MLVGCNLTAGVRFNGEYDKKNNGTYVPLYTEADLFHYLGLKYIPPNERIL